MGCKALALDARETDAAAAVLPPDVCAELQGALPHLSAPLPAQPSTVAIPS